MAVCSELEPKEVFVFSGEIAGIPGPPHHEKKISAYLQHFAKERGLEHCAGKKHSMIIIKEASAGYENEPLIILQRHMDMITEKTADYQKDVTREGLDLYIDGGWFRARGTTSGTDDGVALAYALALPDSPTLRYLRPEFICIVSEEADMGGAHAIDVPMLKGNRMLNLNSDEEGTALTGCASGGGADTTLPVRRAAVKGEHIHLTATDPTGGHSGMEIGRGRVSAALLLAQALTGLHENHTFRSVSLEGGIKHNVIARGTSAEVVLADSVSMSAFREAVKVEEAVLRREYAVTDPGLSLTAAIADSEEAAFTEGSTKQVLELMETLSYGVQRMSADIDGLVETPMDLGITELEADKLTFNCSVRGSTATVFQTVIDKLELVSSCFGATALVYSTYPAQEYVRESAFRDEATTTYYEFFGEKLSVQATYTGLGCGILSGEIKSLNVVSIGPDIKNIHTPEERLNVPPTKRAYDFVMKIIEHRSR